MSPTLRNILAFLAGLIAGGLANMGLILLGAALLPPPAGVDVNDVASINAHIHEYSFIQLFVPFLAHALGALAGGFVVAKLAASRKMLLALVIGGLNLFGGIMAVRMIPNAPMWFDALDLVAAYLPMAWLGAKLARA
ncbi:MAG: hypothetical protein IPL52_04255 [Flavobacteriales bacterium]|nr:hypothetical protein [Flavobacteriales bacterium]